MGAEQVDGVRRTGDVCRGSCPGPESPDSRDSGAALLSSAVRRSALTPPSSPRPHGAA